MKKRKDHLGGHGFKTWVDSGALKYMISKFNIKTMLDIGCGVGGQLIEGSKLGLKTFGIDGDESINYPKNLNVKIHDFSKGPLKDYLFLGNEDIDLCWSVEFLEHIHERYIDNYMKAFLKGKYIIFTHATKGFGGHHHVNENNFLYWKNIFENYNFEYLEQETKELRKKSTMKFHKKIKIIKNDQEEESSFLIKNGYLFKNNN